MTKKTINRHLKELSPFANLYAGIENKLMGASERRLRLWLRICETPTETNCWWATYNAAKMIKPLIQKELAIRAYQKKKAKQSIQ